MRPTLRALAALAPVLLAAGARADCPDRPVSCAYGAIGSQGMCFAWYALCQPCGAARCPALPATVWTDVPNRFTSACIPTILARDPPNGCSNPSPDPASEMYRGLFEPACNAHDLCYENDVGLDKARCDEDFRANMTWICDRYYQGVANLAQLGACRTAAEVWFRAVAWAPPAQTAWDGGRVFVRDNCPAGGTGGLFLFPHGRLLVIPPG